jgi:hypothetical protein
VAPQLRRLELEHQHRLLDAFLLLLPREEILNREPIKRDRAAVRVRVTERT